jgi:hypothetical protein
MMRWSDWMAALAALALVGSVVACSGANMSGVPDGSGGADGAAEQQCKMGSDGTRVCGYDCKMGSNGRVYCADTPDGSCAMNPDGTFTCTRKAAASADEAPEDTAEAAPEDTSAAQTSSGEQARCCVNRAYWSCPDLASVNRCVGEPMSLMSCVQRCGFDSDGCEERCIEAHGPKPDGSGCSRQMARDNECPR